MPTCRTGPGRGLGRARLALHFVTEHGDGRQIATQGQLVAGEQRSAGNREILFAALAAEAERTIRAAGFVSLYRAAGAHTGVPLVSAQRIILKAVSASVSVMRNT
jgi:hypothetical protein